MDTAILTAVLINFAVMGLLIASILAHLLGGWAHSTKCFLVMLSLTFFVTEFWLASATQSDSNIGAGMKVLLIVSIPVTIKYGFDALIRPRFKRVVSPTQVDPPSVEKAEANLSLK